MQRSKVRRKKKGTEKDRSHRTSCTGKKVIITEKLFQHMSITHAHIAKRSAAERRTDSCVKPECYHSQI
jgi:hypothetical protein